MNYIRLPETEEYHNISFLNASLKHVTKMNMEPYVNLVRLSRWYFVQLGIYSTLES